MPKLPSLPGLPAPVSRLLAPVVEPVAEAVAGAVDGARVLVGTRYVRPERPDRLVRAGLGLLRWGVTPAAGYAASAARTPDAVAVSDDAGVLTFAELDRRTNAIARGLAELGVGTDGAVGILVRNSRAFLEATVAAAKVGADCVYLNTGFAGPQLADACDREGVTAIVVDAELLPLTDTAADRGWTRVAAWVGPQETVPAGVPTLDGLAAAHSTAAPPRPGRAGRQVILTSGTTGAPKGAPRTAPTSITPIVSLLSRIPLRARETHVVAAPLFHAWGFAGFLFGMGLGSTLVLRRHFDPEATLAAVATHRAQVLWAVPVMLQRILELPPEVLERHDTSCLRVVAISGSALPGPLATRWMDTFGDNLHNLYGSTEIGWGSIATPADLRAAPSSAGVPPRGITVRLVDADGRDVAPGETGRIYVGSALTFTGYTGGGDKDRLGGLAATGDLGFFDEAGRLHVAGRSDDMIVSGGENVFPAEVEGVLHTHPAVSDAKVLGVPDEQFGQRLRAYVVRSAQAPADDAALERQLKDHVKAHLARYKVPREVVAVPELPRNATGKVLVRKLLGED